MVVIGPRRRATRPPTPRVPVSNGVNDENAPPFPSAVRKDPGAKACRPPLRAIPPPAPVAPSQSRPMASCRRPDPHPSAATTDRIRVAVRLRPLLPGEEQDGCPWKVSENTIALAKKPFTSFSFDKIFDANCSTAQIYEAHTSDIVHAVVRGFNGTVFAYGQTNSGKTFTMRGSANERGVISLAVDDLFRDIEKDIDRVFVVRMSYMEIYNDDINDLLVPEHKNLKIHESTEKGVYVGGLKEETVTCSEQVMEFMSVGEAHRRIGETNMNLNSSRSHAIIRMIVESREKIDDNKMGDPHDALRVSVLNLVDLAGSERYDKTGAKGERLKEGCKINNSLTALGKVIEKLSEATKGPGGHIPYRDSKLTRILQPALGGNAKTGIICNVTLSQVHADETKNSLQFASKALRVTNCACVNEILKKPELLRHQKKEIEELRAQLAVSKSGEHWKEVLNLQNKLQKAELEKEKISLELEEEKKIKEEQAKIIENLTSLVLNSKRDEKNTILTKVSSPIKEGPISSVNRHEQNMEMPPPFTGLMQECYASCSADISKDDDVSVRDSHDLPHVTSQSKSNANPALGEVNPAPLVEDPKGHSEELEQSSLEKDMRVEQPDVKMAEAHSSDEDYQLKSVEFEQSNASEKLKHSNVSEQPELYGSGAGSVQSKIESDEQVSHTVLNLMTRLQKAELEMEKNSLELEEEMKIKEDQAKTIENLSSLVVNSGSDEKYTILTKFSSLNLFTLLWNSRVRNMNPIVCLVLPFLISDKFTCVYLDKGQY